MYKNLKVELYKKGITLKKYASILGVNEKTARNKINRITDFTYPEFQKTMELFPELDADYVFEESA